MLSSSFCQRENKHKDEERAWVGLSNCTTQRFQCELWSLCGFITPQCRLPRSLPVDSLCLPAAMIAINSVTRTLAHDNGQQFVCFLHGPGGSGKSTIINLVLAYAKEYCCIQRPQIHFSDYCHHCHVRCCSDSLDG